MGRVEKFCALERDRGRVCKHDSVDAIWYKFPLLAKAAKSGAPISNSISGKIGHTYCTCMPELPDITAYIAALEKRIIGQTLERVRLGSPFLLRTVEPPISSVEGRQVQRLRRIGKRI